MQNFSIFNLISLYEKAGLTDRMFLKTLQAIDQLSVDLTRDQQKIIIISYRKSIQVNKLIWRSLTKKQKKTQASKQKNQGILKDQIEKLTQQIESQCKKFIKTISDYLMRKIASPYTQILLYKMKGDLYRCLWEIFYSRQTHKNEAHNDSPQKNKKKSLQKKQAQKQQMYHKILSQIESSYQSSLNIIENKQLDINKSHVYVLGVHLNYSAYFYDIMNDVSQAYEMTSKALEYVSNNEYQTNKTEDYDSFYYEQKEKIVQFLQANIRIWTEESFG